MGVCVWRGREIWVLSRVIRRRTQVWCCRVFHLSAHANTCSCVCVCVQRCRQVHTVNNILLREIFDKSLAINGLLHSDQLCQQLTIRGIDLTDLPWIMMASKVVSDANGQLSFTKFSFVVKRRLPVLRKGVLGRDAALAEVLQVPKQRVSDCPSRAVDIPSFNALRNP